MKNDNNIKIKNSIFARSYRVLLVIYAVLMTGFFVLLVLQEKKAVTKELDTYSMQVSNTTVEILSKYTDENNHIADILKLKKEFAKNPPSFYLPGSPEIALFTNEHELLYSTNSFWRCIYTESVKGDSHNQEYGFLNPKDWFSEEEIFELEDYLYGDRRAKKVGEIDSYALRMEGLWLDKEMIIPDKIWVIPMYAKEIDEDGSVLASSGTRRNDMLYKSNYENTKGLPYFEYGNIIPGHYVNLFNKNQEELRQMVTDSTKLKGLTQSLLFSNISGERIKGLTYRYYMTIPYDYRVSVMEDQSLNSDFWTTVGLDINLWQRISSTFIYVFIFCLFIFVAAALILSKQTYKTYLKQEELERQRKDMTDALAHDLKTPLSIISGYAQNLQEDVHTEKREHYAGHITANVNRMDKIIRKMLEMSRLESDSLEARFEEISLNDICAEIFNRYKQICDEKFITASLDGEAVIKADKSLIERVIDNFVINAIDNTPGGGIISMRILEKTLEVFNSGSHIPEDKINEIWFPYKKGNTERSNTKGTGLGLSISRTILDLHKFSYGAKNTEDGVIFWFKFL